MWLAQPPYRPSLVRLDNTGEREGLSTSLFSLILDRVYGKSVLTSRICAVIPGERVSER